MVPRRAVPNDYSSEAVRHRPFPNPASLDEDDDDDDEDGRGTAGTGQGVGVGRRHSTLAGVTRGTVEGRVDEWRRHIGDD